MKKNKKGVKRARKRLMLLIVVFFASISLISFNIFKVWIQIYENHNNILALQDEYNKLQDQEKQLKSDVNKLQDPDYVARYAREKYMYTKDGETIIKITNSDEGE